MFYFLIYNFLSFLAVYFVIKNDINVASSCLQCQEIFLPILTGEQQDRRQI
jgi:hypothetical protein